jgi:hypothetical protein
VWATGHQSRIVAPDVWSQRCTWHMVATLHLTKIATLRMARVGVVTPMAHGRALSVDVFLKSTR